MTNEAANYQESLIGMALDPYAGGVESILESGITRNDFTGEPRELWIEIESIFSEGGEVSLVKLVEHLPEKAAMLEKCFDAAVPKPMLPGLIDDVKHETLLRNAKSAVMDAT